MLFLHQSRSSGVDTSAIAASNTSRVTVPSPSLAGSPFPTPHYHHPTAPSLSKVDTPTLDHTPLQRVEHITNTHSRLKLLEAREAAVAAREEALSIREDTLVGFLTLYELTTAHLDDMHSKGLRGSTSSTIFEQCTKQDMAPPHILSSPSTPSKPRSPIDAHPLPSVQTPSQTSHDGMSCPPSPITTVSPSKLMSAPATPFPLRHIPKVDYSNETDAGMSGALTSTNHRTVRGSGECSSLPSDSARKALNFAVDDDVVEVVVDCSSEEDEEEYTQRLDPLPHRTEALTGPDGRFSRILRHPPLRRTTPTTSCNTSIFSGPAQSAHKPSNHSTDSAVPSRVFSSKKTLHQRFQEESAQADWVTNHLMSLMTLQEELHNTSNR